jgi:predicted signal transduction protein with EAL and GGDEF domain
VLVVGTEGGKVLFARRVRWQAVLPAVTVIALAVLVVVWRIPGAYRTGARTSGEFWALAALALLVDAPLFAVQKDRAQMQTSLSVGVCFGIYLLWSAEAAIVIQALVGVVNAVGQRRTALLENFFATARFVVAFAAVDLIDALAGPPPTYNLGMTELTTPRVLWFLALAGVWALVSYLLLLVGPLAAGRRSTRQVTEPAVDDLLLSANSLFALPLLLVALPGWWSLLAPAPLFALSFSTRQRIRQEQRLRRDPETGLQNRSGLMARVDVITARDPVRVRPFAVVVLHAGQSVNAVSGILGRDVYEGVQREFARRLLGAFAEHQIARLSGEDIVLLLPDSSEAACFAVAEQATRSLSQSLEVDGLPLRFHFAAGVALSPEHGRDLNSLLVKAELAISAAHREDLPVVVYAPEEAAVTWRRLELIRELAAALGDPGRHGEVGVHYQPQVEVATGRLAGVEALVRWTHPRFGPVSPEEFIQVAETGEVIHLLTRHVVRIAAAQSREWADRGFPVGIAVNASARDLDDEDFVEEVDAAIREHGVSPERLTIEITENTMLAENARVAKAVDRLVRLGVGLSIDDFGTGYASMQRLRMLPVCEVKIDQSYVKAMLTNRAALAAVTGTFGLCEALGLGLVAEGVEDERTAVALARFPGVVGQGWFYGRPAPAADVYDTWRHRLAGVNAGRRADPGGNG